jgi:hypothetical protein
MSYVALDWHPKAKELFYNEKAAEEFAQNESYHMVNIQFIVKYILKVYFFIYNCFVFLIETQSKETSRPTRRMPRTLHNQRKTRRR